MLDMPFNISLSLSLINLPTSLLNTKEKVMRKNHDDFHREGKIKTITLVFWNYFFHFEVRRGRIVN
jgi:hypothetical protein